jgi:hypothetical protein
LHAVHDPGEVVLLATCKTGQHKWLAYSSVDTSFTHCSAVENVALPMQSHLCGYLASLPPS